MTSVTYYLLDNISTQRCRYICDLSPWSLFNGIQFGKRLYLCFIQSNKKIYLIKQHAFIDFCMLLLGKAWHSTKYGRTDLLNLNNWGEGVVVVVNTCKSVFYDVYSSIKSDVIDPPTNSLHSKRGDVTSNFNECVWLFTI